MKIGIIGAGHVGKALAQGWATAGHEIMLGVRDPAAHKHTEATVPDVTVTTIAGAVTGSYVVVLAVPWGAVQDALTACGDLAGRILIDVTNPLSFGANGLELAVGFTTSGGEEVAKLAKGALVFKTMNQIGFNIMANAKGFALEPVMFVAGDDDTRKATVFDLVAALGFDPVDAGSLRNCRLLEPYAMLWIDQAINHRDSGDRAFAFMHRESIQEHSTDNASSRN